MVKWSMNVRRSGGGLEIDSWSEEQRHRTLRDAMREGRRRIETQHQESARCTNKERLPALRASEQQFRVSEAKKAAVLAAFKRMRADGKEVRHVDAIVLLTAKQVQLLLQLQLALRRFLREVNPWPQARTALFEGWTLPVMRSRSCSSTARVTRGVDASSDAFEKLLINGTGDERRGRFQ